MVSRVSTFVIAERNKIQDLISGSYFYIIKYFCFAQRF